jgi:hypothetical protein
MVLTESERNARRQAGVDAMTDVEKIRRDLMGGRPPASEFKTPHSAVIAARALHRELELRMTAAGLKPGPRDCAVSIGYVSTDLSVIGFTPFYAKDTEERLARHLDGQIAVGLVFGMVEQDPAPAHGRHIILGTRAFLTTKQTEEWLSELITPVRLEMDDPAWAAQKGGSDDIQ